MDEQNTPARGDVYLWDGSVRAEVTRVSKDGSWADLRCTLASAVQLAGCTTFLNPNAWSKRVAIPFPESFARVDLDAPMEIVPDAHLADQTTAIVEVRT
jgi:hypothetical protein